MCYLNTYTSHYNTFIYANSIFEHVIHIHTYSTYVFEVNTYSIVRNMYFKNN